MKLTELHDKLLGRRFTFVAPLAGVDFTVIAYNTATRDCFVHTADGSRVHLDLTLVRGCIATGTIQESDQAPFQLPRETKFTRRAAYVSRGRLKDIAGRPEIVSA